MPAVHPPKNKFYPLSSIFYPAHTNDALRAYLVHHLSATNRVAENWQSRHKKSKYTTMKRYSILIPLAIKIILMLAAAVTANAQTNNTGTAPMLTMKVHIVKSTVNNKTYQLYVSLPKNYMVVD